MYYIFVGSVIRALAVRYVKKKKCPNLIWFFNLSFPIAEWYLLTH